MVVIAIIFTAISLLLLWCRPDQIKPELNRCLQMLKVVYNTFGLTYKMALSTRPQEKLGDDAMWDQAEGALQGALDESGLEWEVSPSKPPYTTFQFWDTTSLHNASLAPKSTWH